jgi:hypothetical protein
MHAGIELTLSHHAERQHLRRDPDILTLDLQCNLDILGRDVAAITANETPPRIRDHCPKGYVDDTATPCIRRSDWRASRSEDAERHENTTPPR